MITDMSWLVDFVKSKEGFRSDAYQDLVGVWTIGYGFTHKVKEGDTITREEAGKRLESELLSYLKNVLMFQERFGYDWNNNQVAALTSFSFNLGKRILKQVTDKGTRSNEEIAEKMKLYYNAGGKKVRGLEIRRKEESDHFKGE